jgi:GNAT superfamily N-acetyltransferase
MIRLTTDIPDLPKTMVFEEVYEESLRLSLEDKEDLFEYPTLVVAYLYVDGVLAGETYGVPAQDLFDEGPERESEHLDSADALFKDIATVAECADPLYCYSTTILPRYQGKGYGKVLKAYWLGLTEGSFDGVCGHSTSPTMVALNNWFGAHHNYEPSSEDWYGSGRTAWFYVQFL